MHGVFTKILDHGLKGVIVGSKVEVERGTNKMMCAVGKPKLKGSGYILTLNIINLPPQMGILIPHHGIFDIVRFLIMELHHFLFAIDQIAETVGRSNVQAGHL